MNDEELAKKISEYQKIAKDNPGVDINLLMTSALKEASVAEKGEVKSYRWPYTVSLGIPPFGLYYAVKFYFSDDERDKQAAKLCILLTAVSLILVYGTSKLLFSSAGVSMDQLQQIKPSDIYELSQ